MSKLANLRKTFKTEKYFNRKSGLLYASLLIFIVLSQCSRVKWEPILLRCKIGYIAMKSETSTNY